MLDWPSYLGKVVSTTAGAAAAAAAGAAAAPGGPVAAAAAAAAARKLSDDLLAQFIDAQDDQLERIDQLGQDLRGQMTTLQNSVDGGLDRHWHTALAHIKEASRKPATDRREELEQARLQLFEAWGTAMALLDHDPRSMAPAALRCPAIAQQIAAVYQFMGDPGGTLNWLANAYAASRDQLNGQLSAVYDILVEKMKHPDRVMRKSVRGVTPALNFDVWTTVYPSTDLLWNSMPPEKGERSGYVGRFLLRAALRHQLIERDPGLEGRLMALVELDGEAQLLRRTCLTAGMKTAALPDGPPRVLTTTPRGPSGNEGGEVHLVFDSATRAIISTTTIINGGQVILHGTYREGYVRSPLDRKLNERYVQLPWPPLAGPGSFRAKVIPIELRHRPSL